VIKNTRSAIEEHKKNSRIERKRESLEHLNGWKKVSYK